MYQTKSYQMMCVSYSPHSAYSPSSIKIMKNVSATSEAVTLHVMNYSKRWRPILPIPLSARVHFEIFFLVNMEHDASLSWLLLAYIIWFCHLLLVSAAFVIDFSFRLLEIQSVWHCMTFFKSQSFQLDRAWIVVWFVHSSVAPLQRSES